MQYTLRSRVKTRSFKASTIATTGHSHLRLQPLQRQAIAGEIAVTFDHILDKIHDSVGQNLE